MATDKIGTALPCSVIVQEKTLGKVEVSALNSVASMQAILNGDLHKTAIEVRDKLKKIIKEL
ncbi:DUF302 domain-containing protein [Mucilaginibacter aquariorum]|uniref:DUF302 domain-containing protein n=1 Tax=Mucilaginibacter aquariorum TaxID=2967225 RepID=UPI0021144793|nr:DUF302 domain-containing protein [Mucilaginibacter aquariorum]